MKNGFKRCPFCNDEDVRIVIREYNGGHPEIKGRVGFAECLPYDHRTGDVYEQDIELVYGKGVTLEDAIRLEWNTRPAKPKPPKAFKYLACLFIPVSVMIAISSVVNGNVLWAVTNGINVGTWVWIRKISSDA